MNREQGEITSTLRWSDVVLPRSVSETEIDAIIFSFLTPRWRKTALVVGMAFEKCKKLSLPISAEILAARLQALHATDRVEGMGDMSKWRHSEVRLKPPAVTR